MTMRGSGKAAAATQDLPESVGYSIKRRLLGPPLINEQLAEERLSRPLALGVLSCDGISSAAYGSEEILIELVQVLGYTAAFAILLPMTGVVLFGIALVVLLYREVVSVYTRAGGSYVVARENFGPRVAQVAAVALLIDYVVTVAVQTAGGSAAIVSAFPQLSNTPVIGGKIVLILSVIAILIMCYGNLRGIREAGRTFALPTYMFSGSVGPMIVGGLFRQVTTGLPRAHLTAGTFCNGCKGQPGSGLLTLAVVFVLARAFANGGSSLTGIEAVSNAVSALRRPEGRNARQILVIQGSIVAFLIAGISWLAHATHAVPYQSGYPTVLAQEARPPACVLPRHHRAHRGLADAADRRRGGGQHPDPVLRDRCLHRLHDGRLRHGALSPTAQGPRLAVPHRHQRHRRGLHRPRRRDLRDRQVHRGRLARHPDLPDPDVRLHQAQPRIPDGGPGAGADQHAEEAATRTAHLRAPHGLRLRRRIRPGDHCRPALRAQPAADHPARCTPGHRHRPGGDIAP